MGFLSSAWKSVKNGFKKVFGAVLKPFSKILNSKFFKVAMLAVSVFTMGASLLAAGSWQAAGNLVLQKAAELITLPINLVSKGIGAAGGVLGGSAGAGLQTFANSVQTGLGSLANAAGSVFNVPGSADLGSIAEAASGTSSAFTESAMEGTSAAAENMDAMTNAQKGIDFSGGGISDMGNDAMSGTEFKMPGADPMGTTVPTTLPGEASAVGGAGAASSAAAATPTVPPVGSTAGDYSGTGAGVSAQTTSQGSVLESLEKTQSGGFFSKAMDSVKGAISHMQDNKDVYKMGADIVSNYYKEDPAEALARAKQMEYDGREAAFKPYAQSGFGGSVPGDYTQLQQRNKGLMTTARNAAGGYGNTAAMYGRPA